MFLLGGGSYLIGVGALLAEVSLFMNTAKFSGRAISTATGMLVLAGAMKIFASACEDFGQMNVGELVKGLGSIGVLLLEITAFTKLAGNAKGLTATGFALIEIGAAMKIFASAMDDFGSMSLAGIGKGLLAMGGALAEVANRQVLRVVLWDYDVTTYDRNIIQAFERENPDIRVDVISYRSEIYTSSVQTLLESGAQVDVVYVNQMAMLTELMEKGFSLPLDDLIQQDGIDLSNFLYPDALRNADGALMALPYRTDRFVLYYNRDMFDAAGIAYPDADMTWDALVDTALQLQRHLDKTSGQAERYSVFSIYIPTHWSEYLTSAPFSVDTMDLSQLRQGMQMLIALQQQGAMVPISEIRAQRGVQRLFENGNYGMYLSGTWLMHYLKLDQEAGSCTMYWGVTDRPHWAQMENVDAAWISALSINQNSQRVEAAWRFVQFVCGKAGAEIMVDHLMLPGYWNQEISALEYNYHWQK